MPVPLINYCCRCSKSDYVICSSAHKLTNFKISIAKDFIFLVPVSRKYNNHIDVDFVLSGDGRCSDCPV